MNFNEINKFWIEVQQSLHDMYVLFCNHVMANLKI